MARITLEAVTKDVKNSKTGELVYVQGQTRIRIFDEEQSDGITLEAFEAIAREIIKDLDNTQNTAGGKSGGAKAAGFKNQIPNRTDDEDELNG